MAVRPMRLLSMGISLIVCFIGIQSGRAILMCPLNGHRRCVSLAMQAILASNTGPHSREAQRNWQNSCKTSRKWLQCFLTAGHH